ncbi:helix-hairpin-helix domain-containing protein [Cellulomonas sp.]|uniref:helix-hairpin-helix domain-containing protein n=1 Tax=Cellulomonas sp. TaxID=40001 RepID=UPI0025B94EE5|nr:helix-hairpin-helix domain-containing protein [Cellulomonas sp.]
MPLDRPRVPPDVARRLIALAAHLDDDGPAARSHGERATTARQPPPAPGHAPERQREVAPPRPASGADTGWTPRAPSPGGRAASGAERDVGPAPPTRREPTAVAPVRVPPVVEPLAVEPPVVEPQVEPETVTWRPSVTSALAAASASRPPAPTAAVRWAPGWRTAGSAVLVLALVAGGIVLRAAAAPRGEPVVVPTPAVAASGAGAQEPVDAPDQVVVHVVGAVAQHAVVRLALGARVADAIAAAGGSTPDADLATVNLARVLTDGEQLVVPVAGGPVATPAAAVADGLVDLNSASAAELEELPGVGPVLAARIVQHRTEQPFTTVDELDDVAGIGPALLADLRTRVRV